MKTVVVKAGQTMADIAVQMCGSANAVCELAKVNGLSITDELPDGIMIKIPETIYNRKMQILCEKNKVRPATELKKDVRGIFSKEFTNEFK